MVRRCRAIMLQGCGSNVGKSMLVAGICRAFARRGLTVRPFKPQNMSNNAAVTSNGGEIGRAQALQAQACYTAAHTDMNPVLLKPQSETGSQVVVCGRHIATVKAKEYGRYKTRLMTSVLESFKRLSSTADIIIVEGAGSAAEINLRAGDIANMGFAEAAGVPVILVGDIDRGGVIAQLVGTTVVLPPEDTAHIKGFLVNKFRGDPALFRDGYTYIEKHTHWTGLGVVPWFDKAHELPAEDSMDLGSRKTLTAVLPDNHIHIAVPHFSRIANFDDLDPLRLQPDITIDLVPAGKPLPREADIILLPGTKSTRDDLAYLRAQQWDIDIHAHARHGGTVVGLCGGFQMLGHTVHDPHGIEGIAGTSRGLGLLDIETTMSTLKTVEQVSGYGYDASFDAYEIHVGQTTGVALGAPWLRVAGHPHGAIKNNIMGGYVHGIFGNDLFRQNFFNSLNHTLLPVAYNDRIEEVLDHLADHIEQYIDLDRLYALSAEVDLF